MLSLAAIVLAASTSVALGKTTVENDVTRQTRACLPPFDTLPYCDTTLDLDTRVEDFITRLWQNSSWIPPQLTARHGGGGNPGPTDAVPELGLPEWNFGLNCIHGVQSGCVSSQDGTVHCPTSFPNPVNFGAAWNDSLVFDMAAIIAEETRALWLAGAGEESSWSGRGHIGLDVWSPNVNIARDPRWGRNVEVASEEPMLNGNFGVQYTRGVQEGEDSRYYKTVVTLKHWDAYSLENSDGFTRNNFNAIVSNYGLASTYLPAFRTSIVDAKAAGVMCSYNAVNGEPTCASSTLSHILRDLWNFTGYMTSDTGALEDVYEQHHFVATEDEAACVSLVNGTTDVCSGKVYHDSLLTCPKDAINTALRRTFKLRFQLGLFDPPTTDKPYWNTPLTAVATPASQALNHLATQESMVLLKNSVGASGALPWAPGMKIAVIGPHANATTDLVGNYLGQLCPDDGFECIESPAGAIARLNVGGVTKWEAGTGILDNSTSGWTNALHLAGESDAIVLILGINGEVEGESNDRTEIDLPPVQHALAAACAALGKPTVVFLVHGGSLDTRPERDSPAIHAIVDTFYPGFYGGDTMALTLFGGNSHLGGKMAFTSYPKEYVDSIKMGEMELDVGPGRGYRFYGGEVVWPFGWGKSLTTFTLTLKAQPPSTALTTETTPSITLAYTITVTNTGARVGDEVVQAYFLPQSTPSQPKSKLLKQLFAYKRVHLGPGESVDVPFSLDSSTLRLSDRDSGDLVSTPGTFNLLFTNGVDANLTPQAVKVTGSQVTVKSFPY